MAAKRGGGDDGSEYEIGSNGPAQATAEAFLGRPTLPVPSAKAHPPADKPGEEKISLFWRVFGGTLISVAALAVVTMYNAVTTNVSELRGELARTSAELSRQQADLRTDLGRSNEAKADLLPKAEFATRMTTAWDAVKNLQAQNNTQNAALAAQRSELDGVKDRTNRQGTDFEVAKKDFAAALEALKKDQAAVTDALKKDLAAVEVLKDRLAAVAGDVKTAREEGAKVRAELDRNQAYDQERKDSRDKQAKAFDEAMKELAKGVQDCREKLARLEGQSGPAAVGPPAPKKTAAPPRPARPAAARPRADDGTGE